MNIAKKLLFSLLLCGTVFAAACGDDGKTAGKGETCNSETKCEGTLLCVVNDEAATSGTCKEACTTKDQCKTGEMTECTDAKVLKDTTAGKVCSKPAAGQGGAKVAEGESCAGGKACVDGSVCYQDKCTFKCDAVGDDAPKCKSSQVGPTCKALTVNGETMNLCQKKGATAKTEGDACSATDQCGSADLYCVGQICHKKCQAKGVASGDCDTKPEFPSCMEVTDIGGQSVTACVEKPVAKGEDCTGGKTCEDGTLCENNICEKECPTPGAPATECSSETTKPNCVAIPSGPNQGKNICQA